MDNEVKNKILELLIDKAPNSVSEIILNAHDIHDDENFQRAVKELQDDGQIVKETDPRKEIAKPLNYYRVKLTENLPIKTPASKLNVSQFYHQGFWYSLGQNFAVLIPFCFILIVFALLMWFILTRK